MLWCRFIRLLLHFCYKSIYYFSYIILSTKNGKNIYLGVLELYIDKSFVMIRLCFNCNIVKES